MLLNNLSPSTERVVDSTAPAHVLAKNGLYRVGTDLFNHKINALKAATQTKQSVTWEFGNQTWNALDWKTDDGLGVVHWYKERAKQLRDNYDYLILAFSGGADSNNIANVFMSADLKIDEVWCDQPLTHTEDYNFNNQDLSAGNMPSEWEFAIKPQLNAIKEKTDWKITLTDSTASMMDEDSEDTLEISQYSYYATVKRWRELDKLVKKANDKYKRVGVIIGIEKPNFILVNGILCSVFTDQTMQYKSDFNAHLQREVEFFYWAPDMPELHRAQCHAFANYIQSNPHYISNFWNARVDRDLTIKFIDTRPVTELSQDFRLLLNHCIYPFWNHNTFQVHKPKNKLYHNEFYDWMKVKFSNHRALDSHRSALDNSLHSLSHEFLSFDNDGKTILNYKSFYSKFYPIVKLNIGS